MKNNRISNPKISVLMSVYNDEEYLREAIESILNQTYDNFEFLIINDASTDSSRDIILSYKDTRIRLIGNDKNIGLSKSLNKGIKLAKCEYIARMDADDISLPERLEKQFNFMELNPNVGVCGTWYKFLDGSDTIYKPPQKSEKIKLLLFLRNVIGHPTAMIRKKCLIENKIRYDGSMEKSQDYNLWVRLREYTEFYNLPDVCLLYRNHSDQISTALKNEQDYYADKERLYQLNRLGINPTKSEWDIHKMICNETYHNIDFDLLENWIEKMVLSNKKCLYFKDKEFSEFFCQKYWKICKSGDMKGIIAFRKSRLNKLCHYPPKIIIKSIIYSLTPLKYFKRQT